MLWLFILATFAVLAYFLFRDTMNKIQYVQTLRIYWITRDTGEKGQQIVSRAFMRQTAPPWWVGRGVQIRVGRYTFQFGILLRRSHGLLDQLGGRDMSADAKEIRTWE